MPTIIKPRKLGILSKVERRGAAATLVVSALGMFSLRGEQDFEPDTALWPTAMREMPAGTIFDAAMPKPCGEMLVAGAAMAPGGEPVPALTLDIALGPLRKRLAVFGERVWRQSASGPVFEPPRPFVEMPLVPERCFGGPSHADNPLGRGADAARRVEAGEIVPLPNVERADQLIRHAADAPTPVRLGPIDPGHPSRRALAGTYDERWLKHDFPGLARDADPRLFCVAPDDQRIDGYFDGAERFRLVGFSAEHPVIEGALPGLRARIFVARADGLFELPSVIDTVWLFPSALKGVLIFRAACPVADIDGDDATHVMLAYERIADEPRPAEHYAEAFRLRSDPDEKIKHILADGPLSPPPHPTILAGRLARREAYHARQLARAERAQELVVRDAVAKAGLSAAFVPALPPPDPPPLWMPTPEEIESGEIDFGALFEGLAAMQAEMTAKGEQLAAQAAEAGSHARTFRESGDVDALDALLGALELPEAATVARQTAYPADFVWPTVQIDEEAALREAIERFESPPGATLLGPARSGLAEALNAPQPRPESRPPSEPDAPLDTTPMRDVPAAPAFPEAPAAMAKLAKALPGLAGPEDTLETLLAGLTGANALPAAPEPGDPRATLEQARARVDAAEPQISAAIATMRLTAPEPAFPIQPLPQAAARRFGDAVMTRAAEGLAGRDMAGADLSGRHFAGLDLRGALFERCDLRGADFTGANCTQAVFAGADLREAVFNLALLNGANLGAVDARGARFARADLRNAQLLKGRFAAADFSAARLADSSFIETDLEGASFAGATLDRVVVLRTPMHRADLSGAVLDGCSLVEVSATNLRAAGVKAFKLSCVTLLAPGADFTGANLQQCGFYAGCGLAESRFDDAVGMNGSFRGSSLPGASFLRASFNRVDFGDADLTGANLRLASLKQAVLAKTVLTRADLFGANLFNAQARRATLDGARLRSANLYGCDLSDASLTGCDLSRANLGKTIFEVVSDAA